MTRWSSEYRRQVPAKLPVTAFVCFPAGLSEATRLSSMTSPSGGRGGEERGEVLQTWAASLPSREVSVCNCPSNVLRCFESILREP